MNNSVYELDPSFRRTQKTKVNGVRTRHVVTFNPNSASPGERVYVE